ncbi:hypothetical protein A2526_03435 [candidate division WOR-1 bacterium RIFOXYD2_FULL_36_8]|uniref:Uncharacterized protein n=1 Tax=candidate division WOR-1 bacterium RIFOXYB2_FULL_36_35 TaxID=1802578 RepID=A0A1F4S5Q6_UNCSA|nr:MAG: hypothetical protein A2230_04885 [candidate division WOR-1 bacterium RIFOXYA2_FULL_36_21]OGC15740.1 MAG: hypothetical protein A2290_05310 [candidate division WOR-1 bacterium RIFOXYB2_FULL_36_35]OGC21095.1 MAG: hypothetical protein A2282_03640 [candidate division WOR-1 bacterium RIFOXYA12_FULL_36_13]OGC41481.1 MAG: hypothetical protein A2526_03435 [candidate division WOR-1 bacterium RIFOXYD2_FULL_36_8]
MNAQEEVLIKKFKRFLDDVKISKPEHLFQLEDKVIKEITRIAETHTSDEAKIVILEIREYLFSHSEINTEPHIKPLLKSFQYSIEGAISTALCCL